MRLIDLTILILAASLLCAGCDSPLKENGPSEAKNRSSNQDWLSPNGELLPLSAYYGVCVKHAKILRVSIDEGMFGYPTIVKLTGVGGELKIGVGKLGAWPGSVIKEVPASSLPRRLQIATFESEKTILVSKFEGSGHNVVSIDYDEKDSAAETEVFRLANNIVACHLSTPPAKTGMSGVTRKAHDVYK